MRLEEDKEEGKKEGRIEGKNRKEDEMRHDEEDEKIRHEKYYHKEDRGKKREKM